MPVFNGSNFLEESIHSVLSQSYKYFEFIIINDASTDNTLDILNDYKTLDKRIKIINNSSQLGIAESLNIGINNSKGKYIARIDADDIWEPQKLSIQINFLKKDPNLVFVFTDYIYINHEGKEIENIKNKNKRLLLGNIYKNILKKNFIVHSSVIFRKETVFYLGLYNNEYKNTEDYELWIKFFASPYKIKIIKKKLVKYRIHSNMISKTRRKEQYKYLIRAKLLGFRLLGFHISYMPYFINDIIYYLIPDSLFSFIHDVKILISIKKKKQP